MTPELVTKWKQLYLERNSILKISKQERVDPGTVSNWLRKTGLELNQGVHFVPQAPIALPKEALPELAAGPEGILRRLNELFWGVTPSAEGLDQLTKFCQFVRLHEKNVGVEETAARVKVHRSTVAGWRNGKALPYLVKLYLRSWGRQPRSGWALLPVSLGSGGNVIGELVEVPTKIERFEDLTRVMQQLRPLDTLKATAERLQVSLENTVDERAEHFAYLLGFMLGDAGKKGGIQRRFTSMGLDLQLSTRAESNKRLGEYVCLCAKSIGIDMYAVDDKQPTGDAALAEVPMPAYRWISRQSPLLAWTFRVCLGLEFGELTSVDQVKMDWILKASIQFRKRFIQGVADSDGTCRDYVVVIASMPNAEFLTNVLLGLGATTARTLFEDGIPMRTSLHILDAAKIPAFNESAQSYRFQLLMKRARVLSEVR